MMILFFGELALAASAVYAARCTLRKSSLWTETLEYHTGLHEQQLM
jgi:cyclin B